MTITLTREEAQQVLDALQCATPPTFSTKLVEDWQSAVEFLRARLAQPEPEPVAWIYNGKLHEFDPSDWAEGDVTPLYTAPPQRVYCSCGDGIVPDDGALCGTCVSLKKMREWQVLTAYEIQELHLANPDWRNFACAIEAKLKEKNT